MKIVLSLSEEQIKMVRELHAYYGFKSMSNTIWSIITKEHKAISPPPYVQVKHTELEIKKQKTVNPKEMSDIEYIYDYLSSFILPKGFKLPKDIDGIKITSRNEFTSDPTDNPKFVYCRGDAWNIELQDIAAAKLYSKKEVERHLLSIQDPSFLPPKSDSSDLISSENYYIWSYLKSKAYTKEQALKLFS